MAQWTGSLINLLYGNSKPATPFVGMGVTELLWTDRNPYEVIEVIDERHLIIRALDYERVDNNGMSESQDYNFFSNEGNHHKKLFLTKKGVWREQMGRKLGTTRYLVGRAEKYYDFSF